MLSSIQNTNFKSNIILSSSIYQSKPLDSLKNVGKSVGSPWSMKQSKILDEGFSDSASICTMGFIKVKDAQKGYLFHSVPENDFEDVELAIKEEADTLTKQSGIEKPQLEGILIGGEAEYKGSPIQYNKLMDLFDDMKIKYTAILGKKSSVGGMSIYTSAPKDEYVLEYFGQVIKDQGSKEKNIKELKKYFEIVKINSEDNITLEQNNILEKISFFQALRQFCLKSQIS